jgi:uncharacterized membrane protein
VPISDNASPPPPSTSARRIQLAALAALTIGYAVLSHYSNTSPNAKWLGAFLSLAPVLLVGSILAWRWAPPLLASLIVAVTGALVYLSWPFLEMHFEWADLVQQCAVYGLITVSFARSLGAGRVPLCTQLAENLHGTLTPDEVTYTRRATAAWAVFYLLTTGLILVLFLAASPRVWSLFVNFAIFGFIALMCVADYLIRRRILPRRETSILATLRQSLIG